MKHGVNIYIYFDSSHLFILRRKEVVRQNVLICLPSNYSPSFERMLPSEGRKHSGGTIGQRYEDAQGFAEEGLARARGLVTTGIDGHRDRRGRAVWTICRLKMGISVFETCTWSGRRSQTGIEHAKELETVIDDSTKFIGVVSDNAANMLSMQAELSKRYQDLLFTGCFVRQSHPPLLQRPIEEVGKEDHKAAAGSARVTTRLGDGTEEHRERGMNRASP